MWLDPLGTSVQVLMKVVLGKILINMNNYIRDLGTPFPPPKKNKTEKGPLGYCSKSMRDFGYYI